MTVEDVWTTHAPVVAGVHPRVAFASGMTRIWSAGVDDVRGVAGAVPDKTESFGEGDLGFVRRVVGHGLSGLSCVAPLRQEVYWQTLPAYARTFFRYLPESHEATCGANRMVITLPRHVVVTRSLSTPGW